MSWTRMVQRIVISTLACATLTAPIGAVAAPAAAPPDGTYGYTVIRSGQKAGDSTVTVKRAGTGISVHEVETFTGVTDTVDETLDPNNLMPTAYVASFPLTAEVGITAHLAFYSGGARETVDGTSGATDFRLETGTTHLVVVDGAMMSGFLFLPAQVKALSLSSFTTLSPSRADTYNCHVDSSANLARPELVPKADVSIVIDGSSPSGNARFVEWYDPQTFTVDELDVPGQAVTIIRKPGIK